MCCKIDLTQETGEPTNQGDHHRNEKYAAEPLEVCSEEFLDKERNDDDTKKQRRSSTEIYRPTRQVAPTLEIVNFRSRNRACLFV